MIRAKENSLKSMNNQIDELKKEINFLKEKRTNEISEMKKSSDLMKLTEICSKMADCLEWKPQEKEAGSISAREEKTKKLFNENAGYKNAAEVGTPMNMAPPESKQKVEEMMDVYYELNPILITILGIFEKQEKEILYLKNKVNILEQNLHALDSSWFEQLRRFY